jgi:hypothetical protein
MRHLFSVLVALCVAAGAQGGVRKVKPGDHRDRSGTVHPAESAALFVGVREFKYDETLADVPYAVDDAVDLAYAVAFDGKPRLVDTARVVLALSGEPQKPRSRRNLDQLRAAGAVVQAAGQSDILLLLEHQARLVGRNGILIVAFATHGISDGGAQYLLAATSLLRYRETSVSEAEIREIVSQSGVPRALILLDACRERLTRAARNGDADRRSAAALLRDLAAVDGVAVLAAATAGGYAYDDEVRRNGVFTGAVIDGLQCAAAIDARGFVTVDTLSNYVQERVLTWIRKNRDPEARKATQLQSDGRSRTMPLSACVIDTAAASPPRRR